MRRSLWRVLLFLFLVLPLSPVPQKKNGPPAWSVEMTVEARGEYGMEAFDVKYAGAYSFAFRWTGTLEKDGEDYLLIHNNCDLTKWEVYEISDAAGSFNILTAEKYTDKPKLKVNYILKMEDGLHFDFVVEGFEVPKTPAPDSFYLVLPASKENDENFGGINYDLFVKTGSNNVVMDEREFLHEPAERVFAWTWKHRTWVPKQEKTVFLAGGHEAKVKIKIAPRKEIKKGGIPREKRQRI